MATIVKLWDNGDEFTLVTSGSGISISSDQNLTGSTRQKTIRIQTTDEGLYQDIVINQGIQSAVQDGYWVHKDTNAVTYFGADADFITDGMMSSPSWGSDCSEVQLPSGVTGLESFAFWRCTSLTSIIIPEGVTSLGGSCFEECTSLTSITLPESVTSLGSFCFYRCYALPSITLPEGVTSIDGYTFNECSSLTSINIPESVTSLGIHCFRYCSSLTSITIPESVTNIMEYCFSDCTYLALATVLPATPPSLGSQAFDNVHSSFNIKVRSPYVNAYKTATNWVAHAAKISAI